MTADTNGATHGVELMRGGRARAVPLHNQALAIHTRWRQAPWQLNILDQALGLWHAALACLDEQDPEFPSVAVSVASALHDRHERTGEQPELDEAILLMERAIRHTSPADYQAWVGRRTLLRVFVAQRFDTTRNAADAVRAAEVGREIAWHVADDDPDACIHRCKGAEAISELGSLKRDITLLDEALVLYRRAAQSPRPDVHPDLPHWGAASCAMYRYRISGDLADVRTALVDVEQAMTMAMAGTTMGNLIVFGLVLTVHCEATGEADRLDEVVDRLGEAMAEWRRHRDRYDVKDGLGLLIVYATALSARYRARDIEDDFHFAQRMFEEALALDGPAGRQRADVMFRLGGLLVERCRRIPFSLPEIDGIARLAEESFLLLPSGHNSHGLHLMLLGDVHHITGNRTWNRAALEEAAACYEKAAQCLPARSIEACRALSRRAAVLLDVFQHDAHLSALQTAVTAAEEALRSASPDHPDWALLHSHVGEVLRLRYELGRDARDLTRAEHHARTAATLLTKADSAHYAVIQSNLALVVAASDRPSADVEAASMLRSALREGKLVSADRARLRYNLGVLLRQTAGATGDGRLLEEAVEHIRDAVRGAPPGDTARALYRRGLASAILLQWERGDITPAKLEDALAEAQAAVRDAEDGAYRALSLNALGTLFLVRHREHRDPRDLDQALKALQESVKALPRNHVHYGTLLTQYGEALHIWARLQGRPESSDLALSLLRRGLAHCPPDAPARAESAVFLADALGERPKIDDLEQAEALELYREAAGHSTARPSVRLRAATRWGQMLASAGDWRGALEGYAMAIALLPVAAWPGLSLHDRLWMLKDHSYLPAEAAAVAINAGEPERAVELLEGGRGLLLSHALNMRSDLDALRQLDPEAAKELDQVRRTLEATHKEDLFGAGSAAESRQRAERLRELHRRWQEMVGRVRSIPGLERFLTPPDFGDLVVAGARGPVVLINVCQLRSDALILADGTVTVLPLPSLDAAEAQRWAQTWTRAFADGQGDPRPVRPLLNELLRWLWDTVAGPVLYTLHPSGESNRDGDLPRLWWCPIGPLNRLPLHAASRCAGGVVEIVADRVASSYTPTVRALLEARMPLAEGRPIRPLLIAVSHVPETTQLPLPNAAEELGRVRGHLPPGKELKDETATREQVLSDLSDHDWLHFVGHGAQPPDSADGVLYTWDHASTGSIRVADVSALRLHGAKLAFLSACETLRAPADHPDEAVHLAGAMQLAGFRHVVAAQWRITGYSAADVAESFYAGLRGEDGGLDADRAAYALHEALHQLREDRPDAVERWASYVHVGP